MKINCLLRPRIMALTSGYSGKLKKRSTFAKRSLSLLTSGIFLLLFTAAASSAKKPSYCFYSVSQSENSIQLIEFDPHDASVVSAVNLYNVNGSVPDIQTFGLAFSPDGTLYGWDSTAGQLYRISYTSNSTAQINYVGSPTGQKVTGLAFDNTGALYGIKATANTSYWEFVSINTQNSAITFIGGMPDLRSNGMAVDFSTGTLYGVSGNEKDGIFTIDKNTGNIKFIESSGTTAHGVGAEFLPGTKTLYSVRNMKELWKFDMDTSESSYIGIVGGPDSTFNTVSLAAKWPEKRSVLSKPVIFTLFIIGGTTIARMRYLKKRRSFNKNL